MSFGRLRVSGLRSVYKSVLCHLASPSWQDQLPRCSCPLLPNACIAPKLIVNNQTRPFSTGLSELEYEKTCDATLEQLTEELEALAESEAAPQDSDITFSNGVLTLQLGQHGTYVINKQTPNKQIWLSSPTSGPKRYDYVDGIWLYKRDSVALYTLLENELSIIFKQKIHLTENLL